MWTEHFKILSVFINLLAGVWIVTWLIQLKYKLRPPIKKYLIQYAIFFNLIILYLLLAKYQDVNVPINSLKDSFLGINHIGLLFGFICTIGMLDAMIKICLIFWNQKYTSLLRYSLYGFFILVILGHLILILTNHSNDNAFLTNIILGIEDNILITEVIALLILLFSKTKKTYQKSKNAFAWYYLSRYCIFIFLIIPINEIRIVLAAIAVLYINLLPFLWIKYHSLKISKETVTMESLTRDFLLTERESEITRLIYEGLNNTDIAAKLYISQHTVKNHVYNIFQKFEIKHRYELIHLLNSKEK